MSNLFINTAIKIFFLLTPFFVMSMFLSMTRDMTSEERHRIAIRTTVAIAITTMILFYFGNVIFRLLGITIQSFEIGAGALLFLSAVSLVQSQKMPGPTESEDISVVPLALPLTVGPGTTGTLLVMGAEIASPAEKTIAACAVLLAVLVVGMLLLLAVRIKKKLGEKGLNVLTKLTGLVLAALAAQLIFTGIRQFNAIQ
jgi:multiple antibiotic resistance protein